MRILMLGWEFPPHMQGGLGTACFGLTQALTKQRVEVLFVLPRYTAKNTFDNSRLSLLSASGTPIQPLPVSQLKYVEEVWEKYLCVKPLKSLLYPYATEQTYAEQLQAMGSTNHTSSMTINTPDNQQGYELKGDYGKDLMSEVFRYSQAVGSLCKKERFDIIHAHDWMAFPAGIVVKKITGKPLIVHVHALEFDRSGHNINHEVAKIERMGLQAADHVIAVSHLTKRLIVQEYGLNPNKITVVHNAVARKNAGVYHKNTDGLIEKRILFMGRITFQKGPEYFIEAANLVLKLMPDIRFVMAGSGDMLTRMVNMAAKLRMGNRIHFTGFLRGSDVDRMYALSDLYVMPSVSEPFGIAPLEAMLYDVPVLISKQSGVAEVVRNALKVDFWDVQEMANKIYAVLKHPQLANEVVKNCREELKNIKWDNAATLLKDVYKNISPAR